MRSLLLLILYGYFIVSADSRPSRVEEKKCNRNTEENEYENGGEEAMEEETVQEDEENSAVGLSDNKSGQYNYPLDEKPDPSLDREFQSSLVHRNMRTNEEPTNRLKNAVHTLDQDLIAMKSSDNKKMTASQDESNEEGDLLFENNENRNGQMNTIDTNSYNNERADSNTQASYYKKHYNNMRMDNRETEEGKKYAGRGRREIQESRQKDDLSSNENEELENNENEEAAIRKHVKKLSGAELEELLNSLSGDKRELLKKIMESDPANTKDTISKREITKKAGAAEENIESALLDSSKLQSGSEGTASPSSIGSSSESSKSQEPQTEILTTKGIELPSYSTDSGNKAVSTNTDNQGLSSAALDESKIQANSNSNLQINTKAEIKREANIDDLANYEMENSFKDSEYIDNDQYMCADDNNQSNEPQTYDKNGNMYKRDTNSATDKNTADSIKSLEESFPNSNKYDDADPYSGSDMAPLIRVKRKNEDMLIKKRAAALLPDVKVAYFPNQAENDDEDTEESNEFDNDGFYERSSNLGKKYECEVTMENLESPSRNIHRNVVAQSKVESDTNNLGSDTDNVLSGVEGVDENLMLKSGLRNRRTIDDNLKLELQPQDSSNRPNRHFPTTTSTENDNSPSENYMGVPNYQENDAFGLLPRNYETELSRYKRIRHVKQPPAPQEPALKT